MSDVIESMAREYVEDLFRKEYPWAIDEDGGHRIVEFSETNLEEAFFAGFTKALDWLAEPGDGAIMAGHEATKSQFDLKAAYTVLWQAMLVEMRKEALGD